ncbi:MAG: DUF3560 domain-containing protein [Defluviitaleaceae bacterium]|nr:DUF3560 domain-containing protein [Defluviitaleaceae bacterium]MCL2273652.1 DUF3560 domain-containing protein [Defluviitaleaceae bacterium]
MNAYEERKQARIDGYNARAAKATKQSNTLAQESIDMISIIPPGQPTLVGHHSESRHRNHLKRADNKMRRSVDESDKAAYYAAKAEAAENNTAISSDDPEAITKLDAQLTALEEKQTYMKRGNIHYRKHGTMKGYANITDDKAAALDEEIKSCSWARQPFASYTLQNNTANIRRIKGRISALKKKQTLPPDAGWAFDGGRVVMNVECNRIQIHFDTKPDDEVRKELKGRGFKWAPSVGVWQRHLNGNGMYAVKQVKSIQPIEQENVT